MTTSQTTTIPEKIRQSALHIPAAAGIYARLQSLISNPAASMSDIMDLVKLDAGLASAVVRSANSAYNRQSEPIESVNDAINRVGLREVHRIIGHAVAGQLFVQHLSLYQIPAKLIWENSIATALAMSVLSCLAREDDRPAYTLGLLRPTGRLVLQNVAKSGRPFLETIVPAGAGDEAEYERAYFGASNPEVTAYLLETWRLPVNLSEAARHHQQPEYAPLSAKSLAARLHVACWIASTLGKGLPAETRLWRNTPELVELAGLPPDAPQSSLMDIRSELNRMGALLRGAPA